MFETRATAVRFDRIGAFVEGDIVDVRRTQQTEFRTFIPLYWERQGNGAKKVTNSVNAATGKPNDPALQWEITLNTALPDENGDTDRRLFIRGPRMEKALRQAVANGGAGRDGLLIGGWLHCAWTGTEPSPGGQDAKLYTFMYRPPAAGEGTRPDPTPQLAGHEFTETPPVASFASGGSVIPSPTYRATVTRPMASQDDEPPF